MANHNSAKKALRQTIKRTLINKSRVSRMKTYIKKVLHIVANGSKENAKLAFVTAQSEIMKNVTKNILKLNAASRKISRLAQKIKNMTV
jgi:small subunit ribosomal protein S20